MANFCSDHFNGDAELGKNFMGFTELFLDFMPGYNKFRAVTIVLVVAELCIPLLGVFFLHKLYTAKEEIQKNLKPFLIVSGAVVFVMLVFLAMPSAVSNFLSDGEREVIATADPAQVGVYEEFFGELEKVRISIFRKDVGRSLIFLILAIGVIYAYTKNAFKANIAVGVLGVLILTDLILVDSRYLNTEASGKNYKQWIEGYKQKYPYVAGDGEKTILAFELEKNPALFIKLDSATNAVKAIPGYGELEAGEKQRLNDWSTYRTLNRYTNFRVYENGNPFNSSYTSYFNKSIGGYHGAKLGRYQELIEFHLDKRNPAVLDMLNMRYKIQPVGNNEGKIVNSSFLGENPTAMGNAWLAKEIQTVQTADEEILALNSGNLYSVNSFGSHKLLINGELDSAANVIESDTVELIYVMGIDSAGNMMSDTVPVQIPYQAVTADMPLAFILGPQGANWDYVVNVDSTEMPLVGVKSEGRAGWDPNKTTIVHQEFKANISQDSYSGNGTIEMTSYHPDHLIYNFSSAEKQLVVFSEIYYPIGWKALVDSKEVSISRVNYVLRAIEVEGGDHKIELVYEVPSMKSSAALAWAGSVLLLVLIAFGIFMDSKVKDEVVEE
ncbi:MAG: YfhO family protein [Crocinitomicaceae bacterium]|nr:YfhO family protein [Crocinitomicaceae bacterium]